MIHAFPFRGRRLKELDRDGGGNENPGETMRRKISSDVGFGSNIFLDNILHLKNLFNFHIPLNFFDVSPCFVLSFLILNFLILNTYICIFL